MWALLSMFNPLRLLTGAVQSSGAVVGDFFGSTSKKGQKTVFVLILLGLLVVIPHLRVKMAQHAAKEAAVKAEELKYDVARAEMSARDAEAQRDKEAEARVIEREEMRKANAAAEFYLKQQAAREATVNSRLEKIANALNARKAGDVVAGDSAVILRNLNKVGIESVAGSGGAAPPASADPVPHIVGPVADASGGGGIADGGAEPRPDEGVRSSTSAGGAQQ